MHKISARKIRLCMQSEYVKWIRDPRMIVFAALLVFVHSFVMQPLSSIAKDMGDRMSIWEPFVAVCNVQLIMLAVPLVFLVLTSDFPRTDHNSIFFIPRVGRLNWVLAQIMLMMVQVLSYLGTLFVFVLIFSLPYCTLDNNWSNAAVDFLTTFPEEIASFRGNLLNGQLYRQMLLPEALLHSLALTALLLFLIGMIQLLFSVLKLRKIGFIVSAGMIAAGQALAFINSGAAWWFPVAHALVKMHFTSYFREPVVPIELSYAYFGGLALVLILLSIWRIRKYDYDSILEVE